ncbi:MAG: hypothetical protein B9S38_16530 [Verrucomicrobiia bacterium Tous-C4TDCM]|nr:MAG: hypothetical protein B9S38_16530 [Verrucomicrobiae bacterium Tous-C4TDCM]
MHHLGYPGDRRGERSDHGGELQVERRVLIAANSTHHVGNAASAASNIYYNGTKFTLNSNSGTWASALIGSAGTTSNQIKNGGLKIDTASFNATIPRGLAKFTGHPGVLTKEGAGTLTVAAAGSTYSQTVVNGGVLDFPGTDVLGNHTSSIHGLTINAGALVTNSTIAGGFNKSRTWPSTAAN